MYLFNAELIEFFNAFQTLFEQHALEGTVVWQTRKITLSLLCHAV